MQGLVIGGTEFIRVTLIRALLGDGHWEITLNRVTRTTTCLAVAIA
jgi:hypothetical protein